MKKNFYEYCDICDQPIYEGEKFITYFSEGEACIAHETCVEDLEEKVGRASCVNPDDCFI